MPVGDKEAAVIACVNAALQRRGYNPPYDLTQKMNGVPVYGYQSATMFMFHRQVKACLAGKGANYVYSETNAYMDQTVAMTLADVYATIAVKTTVGAPAPAGAAEAAPAETAARRAAPKRAKKAAKRRRTTGKAKPAKRKNKPAKKKKGAGKKAAVPKKRKTASVRKRKAAKRNKR